MHHFHNLQGEQKDQLLIVTDKDGKQIGLSTREECHKGDGKTHLAFMAFVVDEREQIVLTKRSKNKSLFASFWDASVVSHVLPGETVEEAAKRRSREELGIEVEFKKIGSFCYFSKYKKSSENEYCFVLVGEINMEIVPNPVEISQVKKITLPELKKEIRQNPKVFTPWLKLALEKIDLESVISMDTKT